MNAEFCFDDLFTLHISGFLFSTYLSLHITFSHAHGEICISLFQKIGLLGYSFKFTVTKSLPNMPNICHENFNFRHQSYRDYLEYIVSK